MPRHFGVLIPSTNTTVEIEYNRLLPADYQAHVGRLKSSGGTPFVPSIGAGGDYQAELVGTGKAREAFQRIDRAEIEVLVVPGGNFPTMAFVPDWEREFGKPVITTNQ